MGVHESKAGALGGNWEGVAGMARLGAAWLRHNGRKRCRGGNRGAGSTREQGKRRARRERRAGGKVHRTWVAAGPRELGRVRGGPAAGATRSVWAPRPRACSPARGPKRWSERNEGIAFARQRALLAARPPACYELKGKPGTLPAKGAKTKDRAAEIASDAARARASARGRGRQGLSHWMLGWRGRRLRVCVLRITDLLKGPKRQRATRGHAGAAPGGRAKSRGRRAPPANAPPLGRLCRAGVGRRRPGSRRRAANPGAPPPPGRSRRVTPRWGLRQCPVSRTAPPPHHSPRSTSA